MRVTATAKVTGRTGVEMEALTAVSVACLTVYDMVKAVDREMVIEGVRLVSKTGGPGETGAAPIRRPGGRGLLIDRRLARETTDRQVQRSRPAHAAHLLVRGGLLLVTAGVIGTLAGWTKRVRATDQRPAPDAGFVARRIGQLGDQLAAARGEMDLLKIQLDRANADHGQLDQVPDSGRSRGRSTISR